MKYEFGSPAWLGALHATFAERVGALLREQPDRTATLSYSICEVMTSPPATVSPDGSPIAWWCVIDGGAVAFGLGEIDDVGRKVTIDYSAALPLARFDTRGSHEGEVEMGRLLQATIDQGLAKRIVRDETRPAGLNVHDAMARLTR
jgi:hypothetical protein